MVYWFQLFKGVAPVKKLENFWFYYKKHLLIGLAVILVLGYLGIQKALTPEPDYHIGCVRSTPLTEDELLRLESAFTAAGEDLNGDGQVLVQIHTYYADLTAASPDDQVICALDADLVGGVSGIFLAEDPETFQALTNGIFSDAASAAENGLYLLVRGDAPAHYPALAENLN